MGRGRWFEGQFAAETITRPAKGEEKWGIYPAFSALFSCLSALVSVWSPDRLPGIEAARGHPWRIGRMKIGHSGALVPGRKRQAVGAPNTHTLA
jgi:hypothetical protein